MMSCDLLFFVSNIDWTTALLFNVNILVQCRVFDCIKNVSQFGLQKKKKKKKGVSRIPTKSCCGTSFVVAPHSLYLPYTVEP